MCFSVVKCDETQNLLLRWRYDKCIASCNYNNRPGTILRTGAWCDRRPHLRTVQRCRGRRIRTCRTPRASSRRSRCCERDWSSWTKKKDFVFKEMKILTFTLRLRLRWVKFSGRSLKNIRNIRRLVKIIGSLKISFCVLIIKNE